MHYVHNDNYINNIIINRLFIQNNISAQCCTRVLKGAHLLTTSNFSTKVGKFITPEKKLFQSALNVSLPGIALPV